MRYVSTEEFEIRREAARKKFKIKKSNSSGWKDIRKGTKNPENKVRKNAGHKKGIKEAPLQVPVSGQAD